MKNQKIKKHALPNNTATIKAKANYLKDKINNSWYKDAKIDYGVKGKVKRVSVRGDTISVKVKENGKTLKTSLPYASNYTARELYNIWMENPQDCKPAHNGQKRSKR